MNYSIDHNLLKDPYIESLKGSKRVASWIALCFITHWTKHAGYADFHSTAFAQSYGWKPATVKSALEGLVEAGLIVCIREYSRKANLPRRYKAKRYSPKVNKVRPQGMKGTSPGDNNNNVNYYNTQGESFNTPPPVNVSPLTPEQIEEYKTRTK